ncbi:FAD-dependent monooxygenase [Kutzneria sp. 744]|uniref:FAD-dependent monooxygenase n=1 Tax=Kutzneria sp. (strain 744) TaxID=345341 RepID=UPI0003EEA7F4|nr:FAD-dependent monooxygenase [Kutzneria sp. 744]EWM15265.1 monooxygenase, FAD-binding [Kutzneria sp. 744]
MTHALIIGGGIAGPVTAMALGKAGMTATVYEAYASGADDIGAFMMIMHNGFDALGALDAQHAVVANSFSTTKNASFEPDGTPLPVRPIGTQRTTFASPRTLKRADLYRALHDELARRGGIIEHGKRFVHTTTDPSGTVVAHFADGSTAEGDLLVGADGIRSTVRRIVDPSSPSPRFVGLNVIFGYTEDRSLPFADDVMRMLRGKRATLGHTTSPEGEHFWYTRLPGEEMSQAEAAAMTASEWRQLALDFFVSDGNVLAADVVSATDDAVLGRGVYDMPPMPTWHRSSVVLVGDAAHAASPAAAQGASMAMEDSVVLAKCLRDLPDLDQAFAAYELVRRERAERLVAYSRGDIRTPNGDWLYSHSIDWEEPVRRVAQERT